VNEQLLTAADFVDIMGADIYPRASAPRPVWDFQYPTDKSIAHYRAQRDAIRQQARGFILSAIK
jgi:hypothetical protein